VEAVVFCGVQGGGKTRFFRQRFFDTHVRVNLDMLRTRRREAILIDACIRASQRFAVDNTNPTTEDRRRYVAPAVQARFRVIGYWFDVPLGTAIERNAARYGRERVLGQERGRDVPATGAPLARRGVRRGLPGSARSRALVHRGRDPQAAGIGGSRFGPFNGTWARVGAFSVI
jgi:hypothetical protein